MNKKDKQDLSEMVDALDMDGWSGKPGSGKAFKKLKALATTTGKEYDALVKEYLAEWRSQRRSGNAE